MIKSNVSLFAWALDFVQAIRERPLWARLLIRLAMGRYAYREFLGLMRSLKADGHYLDNGYLLKDMDYHQEDLPLDFLRDE